MFRPIGIWQAAGLADKSAAYFRNCTPKNEKILLLASEKACAKLFRKMGGEGKALAQDKAIFDAATREVFNLLREKGGSGAPEMFSKGFYGIGLASTVLSFGISAFAKLPDFWKIPMDSMSAGKAFIITTLVSTFIGSMFNHLRLADFREDAIRVFYGTVKACEAGGATKGIRHDAPKSSSLAGNKLALD